MDNQLNFDKDGLPVNEKGEYVCRMNNDGNVAHFFSNGEAVIFHPKNKAQVNAAAKKIAVLLTKGFLKNIDNCLSIGFSEQGIKKLNERGFDNNGEKLKIPLVNMYFDGVNKKLNYFGNLHSFKFEYLIYVFYKEALMNQYLFIKSGLYKKEVPKTHIKFAKLWFKEKDKIYTQKMNLNNESNQIQISKEPEKAEEQNPHPRIFANRLAFDLFEHWNNQVSERTQLAEYSFIYWAMVKDKFIYEGVRPTEFINFLSKEYQVTAISELKQYNNCKGGGKESKYSTARLLFKQ